MSPIPLSQEEWDKINAELPDVEPLIKRIINWPYVEYISFQDVEKVERLRLSSVRFRDAVEKLRNANYALSQALGVRKYYLDKSSTERDEYSIKADWYSRFYMDYVPLLLHSAVAHCSKGLVDLHGLKESLRVPKSSYLQKELESYFRNLAHNNFDWSVLTKLNSSQSWKHIRNYRDAWVHNKPKIVESILYNPPYVKAISEVGSWKMVDIGYKVPPHYTWDELVKRVVETMLEVSALADAALDEWERIYSTS